MVLFTARLVQEEFYFDIMVDSPCPCLVKKSFIFDIH